MGGLLLRCNVVVQKIEGGTEIVVMDPEMIQRETLNRAMDETASDARERLNRVVNRLPA
jgi:hypothetical protein